MKKGKLREQIGLAPVETCRRGTLRLEAPGIEFADDISADISAILARTLRQCVNRILVLRIERRQIHFVVMVDEMFSAAELIELVRRRSAISMFQLLPTVRAAVASPETIWQGCTTVADRRRQ
ncbi:hypothetical protein [Fodinicurvata sp. EGI_FJ10296]|uniref:hypothetical protein n=1 Tax=Fodinicurvata sp. EGI_FJ10296 TaxID=3231908 RepID=UPI00345461D1